MTLRERLSLRSEDTYLWSIGWNIQWPRTQKRCDWCPKYFTITKNQRFCSKKCFSEYRQEYQRIYQRLYQQKNKINIFQ